jgi:hypothetical protein
MSNAARGTFRLVTEFAKVLQTAIGRTALLEGAVPATEIDAQFERAIAENLQMICLLIVGRKRS